MYLVFSYFFFFIGLIVGVFSAMRRLLQSGLVGLVLIQRVDKSVMPDGFQRFDKGKSCCQVKIDGKNFGVSTAFTTEAEVLRDDRDSPFCLVEQQREV